MTEIQKWIDHHDELELNGSSVTHNGEHIGSHRNGNVFLGPDDGGVQGTVVEFDEETKALIVEGSQACNVGKGNEHHYEDATVLYDGFIEWTGKFAVWPGGEHMPEIDGPYK